MFRFVILFLSFQFVAQEFNKDGIELRDGKLGISGRIMGTSIHYGGIDIDDRNIMPTPYSKLKMYVFRLDSPDSIPKMVKSFTTDRNGSFTIRLERGKYGFSPEENGIKLISDPCLPSKNQETESIIEFNQSVVWWESNKICPLDLSEKSISGLILTRHHRSYCMNCP